MPTIDAPSLKPPPQATISYVCKDAIFLTSFVMVMHSHPITCLFNAAHIITVLISEHAVVSEHAKTEDDAQQQPQQYVKKEREEEGSSVTPSSRNPDINWHSFAVTNSEMQYRPLT